MSQFSKRANPFRDDNGPGDAALGGGTQPESGGTERCLARGCPLPGTVTDSTKGGGPWTCSAHRRAAPDQWDAISQRASRSVWILRALSRLSTDAPTTDLAEKVGEFCVRSGLPNLCYQPQSEDLRQWSWRFRLGAMDWIETGRTAVPQTPRPATMAAVPAVQQAPEWGSESELDDAEVFA
jgi:hypothetical protein